MRRAFEGGAYLKVDATKNCINYLECRGALSGRRLFE